VRGLAVTTLQPSPIMPELPTVAASLPGYESSSLFGIGVAHGTPRDIIDRVNREVNAVLAEPSTRARLVEMGGIVAAGSADDFQKMSIEEVEKWRATVKSSGAKVE
jgi:tripartite-type tricarboxylate transporter receptor subunit TctC